MPETCVAPETAQLTPEKAYRRALRHEIETICHDASEFRAKVALERAATKEAEARLVGLMADLDERLRSATSARADAENALRAYVSEKDARRRSDEDRLLRAGLGIVHGRNLRDVNDRAEIDWHATIALVTNDRAGVVFTLARLLETVRAINDPAIPADRTERVKADLADAIKQAEGVVERYQPKPKPKPPAPVAMALEETPRPRTLLRKCGTCPASFDPRDQEQTLCNDCEARTRPHAYDPDGGECRVCGRGSSAPAHRKDGALPLPI